MAPVIVTISVDWEGRHLRDENLTAMAKFRERFRVPLTHFICPAYFTRGADAGAAERVLGQVLPGDEVGLHIHGWDSLLIASKVPLLVNANAYNYCSAQGDFQALWVRYGVNQYDTGQGLALGAFPSDVVTRLITMSVALLVENALGGSIQGFRAGGWMAPDAVLAAVAASGLTYDSSATDAQVFAVEGIQSPKVPLYRWVADIWGATPQTTPLLANACTQAQVPGGVGSATQPYKLTTASGSLIELPDNGVLADYVDVAHMVGMIRAALRSGAEDPQFVHIGFHQESACISFDTWTQTVLRTTDNLAKIARVLEVLAELDLFDQIDFQTAAGAVKAFTG